MTHSTCAVPTTRCRAEEQRPLPWRSAVLLHLAPGACLTVLYLAAAPVLLAVGLPPLWGLLVGIALVIAPLEVGLVLRSLRVRGTPLSAAALGLHRPTRADLPALAVTASAALVLPGAGVAIEPWLRTTLLGWLPGWYGAGLDGLSTWSTPVQVITLALWFVLAVVLGPVAEELYFRGWLLPRLPGGDAVASVTGACLFGVYHLWQPQAVITIALFALPLSVVVRRRGGVTLAVLVHCGTNLLAFAALLAGVLQR